MNFNIITNCIEAAKDYKPDKRQNIAKIWGDYYSPYYRFFWLIANELPQEGLCVELGVHNGRGLCSLAMSDRKVIGIDHTLIPELTRNIRGFKNITFVHQDSTPVPPEINQEIHLLHIDTEHSYEQAKTEFENYKPHLADNAIVVFDDLHAKDDAVLRYFYELPYQKMQIDHMHPICGWGVMLYQK